MKKRFTHSSTTFLINSTVFMLLLVFSPGSKTYAQVTCNNDSTLFVETFGTGTTPTKDANIKPSALTFQDTGILITDGTYRVINDTKQKENWFSSEDHTPNDVNGKMLIINAGSPINFYSLPLVNVAGFSPATYTVSLYAMNINPGNYCSGNALIPNLIFNVEYLAANLTWVPLTGSPYAAPPLAQTVSPTWVQLGSSFVLPPTGNYKVRAIRIVLSDAIAGGCGNDFALDDIKLSLCPEGGALPVQLLNISAHQKGSGVNVEWATSQEINSSRFEVEKSANGNSNWSTIASVNAAGNSSTQKNYTAYDAKPTPGANYYRLKQVDKDGNAKYSMIVHVNISLAKTGVSVLANPFHNSLTIDFLSNTDQSVSVRLMDMTGKQVSAQKLAITNGSTRKELSDVSRLQQGMYILTVSDANGQLLYNNKVIKQ